MKKLLLPSKIFIIFLLIGFNSNAQVTTIPDANFEQALIDLGIDSQGVLDGRVATNDVNSVTSLDVSNRNISDLTGIEDFTALTSLKCHDNQLANLNVTQNTNLTQLWCHNNKLSSIDVSQNTALSQLYCSTNSLTSLDVTQNTVLSELRCQANSLTSINVTQNTSLTELWCRDNQIISLTLSRNTSLTELICNNNQLTRINMRNGNNAAISNANFNATNNPDLDCIQVDDAAYSTTNWTNIDPQTSFSEDCSAAIPLTYVPDDNFEQALIDLGYDNVMDDYVDTPNVYTITDLDVSSKNIFDFTGIEDFTALEVLNVQSNPITQSITFNSFKSLRCL